MHTVIVMCNINTKQLLDNRFVSVTEYIVYVTSHVRNHNAVVQNLNACMDILKNIFLSKTSCSW